VVAALWGFSASHHAVGRLFERAPGVDARAALLAAHGAVIAGCRSHAVAERTKLLIPAGAVGVFIGRLVRSTFLGQPTGLLVLAETFVTRDMLWREQEDRLLPAATDRDDALAVLPINWTLAKGP